MRIAAASVTFAAVAYLLDTNSVEGKDVKKHVESPVDTSTTTEKAYEHNINHVDSLQLRALHPRLSPKRTKSAKSSKLAKKSTKSTKASKNISAKRSKAAAHAKSIKSIKRHSSSSSSSSSSGDLPGASKPSLRSKNGSSKQSKGGGAGGGRESSSSLETIEEIMAYPDIVEALGIVDRNGIIKLNLVQMKEERMEQEEEERGDEEAVAK
mmetsp:Transcript_5710/g.12048  ORF Transcript_5710/g.12048 Transcript_5710/m.12048 type:complete len:210 (-) Transcript_5710:151-780(-)|eukprot:CAMPEP_0178560222 /NCGR_PEP_ID=MMETSP0697-20121206/11377_1 /TAXON_ID=265572 /ORGANISM="Extubocellulus spinifer, Strain CCMP396" /LENGTH=209 /DNA_ID=CAMNT_0020193475 /DNA_START=191 /DNA_END=820 /DNA_ORIENTATION=+